MALHRIETEIKGKMRELRITTRDLAYFLGMPPGTLANQLGGWTPLNDKNRKQIAAYLYERENIICKDK